MKQIRGFYNASRYYIEVDGKEVYEAGNSPFDSQVFVEPENGVGLRTMRNYCMSTTKELAKELADVNYAGIERVQMD